MRPDRIVLLAAVLAVAGVAAAAAQVVGVNPLQQQQQQPQQNHPCAAFLPIRQEVEQALLTLKAANDRKAPREEFCQIFQKLAVSAGKVVRFFEQNKALCGVPDDAIKRAKNDHAKSLGFRKQACSAAPAPAGPSLSDVLVAPILPESSSNKPDVGTFNTLTGNPLTR
jgi:hypothetical protein